MPLRNQYPSVTPTAPAQPPLQPFRAAPLERYRRPAAQDGDEATGSGIALALGALGLGAGALIMRNPQMAKSGAGQLVKALNVGRMTSMLSGLAVPKSVLGNVGAVVTEAAERKSLTPLRQFFSPQTYRDYKQALKLGGQVGPQPGGSRWNPPGRLMGAGDVATRNALQRAGLTAEEAAKAVLQAPLPPSLASALESPAGQLLVPFRRTPWNQFIEGFETLKFKHPVVASGVMGAGAVHGAAAADERYPVTTGLGIAAASRYGLPYAIGTLLGRRLAGAKTSGSALSSALPFSEYGFETSLTEPLKPFTPEGVAGVRVLKRFLGSR